MQSVRSIKVARQELIQKYGNLFWFVPEKDKANLSIDAIVETILNYGDLEAVRLLIKLFGFKVVSEIFFRQIRHKRVNYYPQVSNFFTYYFNRHASGGTDTAAI
jgi:hypothetical protein